MTFIQRQLRATFSYGTGVDGQGEPTVTVVDNLRMQAHFTSAGAASMGKLQLQIWGLTLSLMNTLTTLGAPLTIFRRNSVLLEAGDADVGYSKVFEGEIFSAYAELNQAPNTYFVVEASTGLYDQTKPAPPYSASGSIDAAKIMAYLADKMGYAFVNDGVSGVFVTDPAFNGTYRAQAVDCARHANIDWNIELGTLYIWPKGAARNVPEVTLAPGAGLVGYPTYTSNGLIVRALFDPRFRFGSSVIVSSALPTAKDQATSQLGKKILPADGKWKIVTLSHSLAAMLPGGDWFTEMMLTIPSNLAVPR